MCTTKRRSFSFVFLKSFAYRGKQVAYSCQKDPSSHCVMYDRTVNGNDVFRGLMITVSFLKA